MRFALFTMWLPSKHASTECTIVILSATQSKYATQFIVLTPHVWCRPNSTGVTNRCTGRAMQASTQTGLPKMVYSWGGIPDCAHVPHKELLQNFSTFSIASECHTSAIANIEYFRCSPPCINLILFLGRCRPPPRHRVQPKPKAWGPPVSGTCHFNPTFAKPRFLAILY